jgi:moderate conductance mechanosensitive channel
LDTLWQQIQEVGWEILFTCVRILIVLLLAWLAMGILKKLLQRLEQRLLGQSKLSGEPPSETENRLETITRLVLKGENR